MTSTPPAASGRSDQTWHSARSPLTFSHHRFADGGACPHAAPFARAHTILAAPIVDEMPLFLATSQVLGRCLLGMSELLARGELRALPCTAYTLSQTASALRQLSLSQHVGKVVVQNPGIKVSGVCRGVCCDV